MEVNPHPGWNARNAGGRCQKRQVTGACLSTASSATSARGSGLTGACFDSKTGSFDPNSAGSASRTFSTCVPAHFRLNFAYVDALLPTRKGQTDTLRRFLQEVQARYSRRSQRVPTNQFDRVVRPLRRDSAVSPQRGLFGLSGFAARSSAGHHHAPQSDAAGRPFIEPMRGKETRSNSTA